MIGIGFIFFNLDELWEQLELIYIGVVNVFIQITPCIVINTVIK